MKQQHGPSLLRAVVALIAVVAGLFGTLKIADVYGQRGNYVETRAGGSAFANQLAPNPVANYLLAVGTDTKQVSWTPGLPTGTPGQVPTIRADTTTGTVTATATQTATGTATVVTGTVTATGTVTGTGTHYEANYPAPDPRGTYFLRWVEIGEYGTLPVWQRWGMLAWNDTALFPANHALSGTCSSGVQALIGSFQIDVNVNGDKNDGKALIPSGDWVFKLRAKVSANAATLRVMVMDHYGTPIAYDHLLIDASTDSFSNTSYQTITKRVSMPEIWREQFSNAGGLEFFVYANCDTSTTVSVELNDPGISSRIETPLVFDELAITDVNNLSPTLTNLGISINSLYDGKSGLPYSAVAGDVLCMNSNPDPYYIITACSPQPAIPVTTRTIFKASLDFYDQSNAVWTIVGTIPNATSVWRLNDSTTSYIYSATFVVPADFVSGMTLAPAWVPAVTDADGSHTVRWRIVYKVLGENTDPTATGTEITWTGRTCSSVGNCTANYLRYETGQAMAGISAGDVVRMTVSRLGSDGADTYVGNLYFVGLKLSYTSSL